MDYVGNPNLGPTLGSDPESFDLFKNGAEKTPKHMSYCQYVCKPKRHGPCMRTLI